MAFIEDLLNYQKNHPNMISCRTSEDGQFRVFKYTKAAYFKGEWNRFTLECRGLTLDKDNKIVSYPFSKFFNYGKEKACAPFSLNEVVYAIKKINGFLAIVSVYEGKLIVHTAGSFNPEYESMIREYIDEDAWLKVLDPNCTYMFECVHVDNPHVTPEKNGLTLIGFRENKIGSDVHFHVYELEFIADRLGCHVSEEQMATLQSIVDLSRTIDYEGFVIYSLDGKRMCKIKGLNFLLKRFTVGLTEANVKKIYEVNLEDYEEEYHPLINFVKENTDYWLSLEHDERIRLLKEML